MTLCRIVAIGDSITESVIGEIPARQRWTTLVELGLAALFPDTTFEVINAGIGGQTTREGLRRFADAVIARQPAFCCIEFGGNDATPEPERAVTLSETAANLSAMLDACGENDIRPVLLTFPPVIDVWHAWRDHPKYAAAGGLDRHIEPVRERTRHLAQAYDCPLADIDLALRDAMRIHGAGSQILRDGVHLTIGGNRTVATSVLSTLAGIIEPHAESAPDTAK